MKRRLFLILLIGVQGLCALFFVSDILISVLGLQVPPLPWEVRELLEIAVAFGLVIGLGMGGIALRQALRGRRDAEEKLRRASVAFMDLLEERFVDWGLTAAERDVALFAIKGMSTAEIAQLRATSEGTVKAQTNAIYRKAGVSGRPQLLSLFIDDMLGEAAVPRAEAAPAPAAVSAR